MRAAAVTLTAALTSVANGARPANPTEREALLTGVLGTDAGGNTFQISAAKVSTVDGRYAYVSGTAFAPDGSEIGQYSSSGKEC